MSIVVEVVYDTEDKYTYQNIFSLRKSQKGQKFHLNHKPLYQRIESTKSKYV